jgi:hypothetical protein
LSTFNQTRKMKKLVLFVAVATMVAFASCGNKSEKTECTEEAAVEVVAPEAEVVAPETVETEATVEEVVETEAAPAE